MGWIGGIAAQNKLVSQGNRLGSEVMVVRPKNVVNDGPYTKIKELIGGYSVVKAESYQEAIEMAKRLPDI